MRVGRWRASSLIVLVLGCGDASALDITESGGDARGAVTGCPIGL